jgi:hypothetical protein
MLYIVLDGDALLLLVRRLLSCVINTWGSTASEDESSAFQTCKPPSADPLANRRLSSNHTTAVVVIDVAVISFPKSNRCLGYIIIGKEAACV